MTERLWRGAGGGKKEKGNCKESTNQHNFNLTIFFYLLYAHQNIINVKR